MQVGRQKRREKALAELKLQLKKDEKKRAPRDDEVSATEEKLGDAGRVARQGGKAEADRRRGIRVRGRGGRADGEGAASTALARAARPRYTTRRTSS